MYKICKTITVWITTALLAATSMITMAKSNMVASSAIDNFSTTIGAIKDNVKDVPVLFPQEVPAPKNDVKYFASADLTLKNNGIDYIINIDASKDCHGARYCNIGSLMAQKGKKIEFYEDRHHKKITIPVTLKHNIKGYFTEEHAMADTFPANIQWQHHGVLYTLNFKGDPKALIPMANSAIESRY